MRTFAPLMLLMLLMLLTPLVSAPLLPAQEWTRFHGPNGQGASDRATIPAKWRDSDFAWKVKLPGIGHSSPVLWGKRIFLLSADPETAMRYVLCLDADSGAVLWRQQYGSEQHHLHKFSSYASCTPTVDERRVYFAWSTPAKTTLLAMTHEGEKVWEKDLGTWTSQHGYGTSPIIYNDLLILHNSQQARQLKPGQKPGKSFMFAFDRETGTERWRKSLESANVCYSVPCIYQPKGGEPQLVCTSTGNGMFSLDPDTGEENWSIDLFTMRTVSSPLIAGNTIFGSTGSGGGGNYVVAVDVKNGKQPEVAYEIKTSAPYVPSSVRRGDLVFLWFDKGVVTCIDAATGKPHWKERVAGNYFGSPVRVGDKVFCINDAGDVAVLAADKEFRLLAVNPLGEMSRSTPAVANNRLYVRTASQLFCVKGSSGG